MARDSLPAAPEELTAAWLTGVLRAAGTLDGASVAAATWERIGADRGFAGVIARMHLRYEPEQASTAVPATLIAKFPALPARDAAPELARHRHERSVREARFYRELAPESGLTVPRAYYTAADDASGRVVLLREDLPAARGGDVLAGCSPEEAAWVLAAIAPLHARWWAQPPTALPWLPAWGGDPQARQERYARQVGPFLARFGDRLPPPIRDLVERLRDGYAGALRALARAPQTVIHADFHLDNVLFNPPGAAPPVVVLDWQSVCVGAAALDVAFFLFGSLPVAERRVATELLREYHGRLAALGVNDYPFEHLLDHCRLALLCQLAGTIGWLSALMDATPTGRQRAVAEAAIGDGRLAAALLDFDAASVLPR